MRLFKYYRRKFRFNRKKSFLLGFLFLLCLGVTVGYAFLTTTLQIDGAVNVASSRWDVHFENVDITTGSVTATTAPTISNDTSIAFVATLENPGDFYEFTVDIVNDGTYNAKIDSFQVTPVLTEEQAKYFDYQITYLDGEAIQQNDALNAGEIETLNIYLKYKENVDTSLYPTEDIDLECSILINYAQGDGNPITISRAPTYRESDMVEGVKTVTIKFSPRCGKNMSVSIKKMMEKK